MSEIENVSNNVQPEAQKPVEEQINVQENVNVQNEQAKKKVRPKIFRSVNDNVEISVFGYYNSNTGELEFALPESKEDDEDTDLIIIQKHTFVFSNIPYNRLNIYKDRSKQYNKIDQTTIIDFLKFNDFIWTFHLKDWNLEDEDGNKVVLRHDPDGTLSDESQEKLWQVPAIILDMVIQMLKDKLNILL